MPENTSIPASCDSVCKTLTEINGTLINNLIERITDVLAEINTSIEAGGQVNRGVLDKLEELRKELSSKSLHVVMDEDRTKVIIFLRRLSSIVGSWSDDERNAMLETLEHSGKNVILIKTKIRRIYWMLISAGALTILTQVGAPDWIQKLFKMIFGA